MKQFEFTKKDLDIKFPGGEIFTIDMEDPDFIEALQSFQKRATEEAARLKAYTGENYADALREATKFMVSTIDNILGGGACERIFEGKKIRFSDTLDVVMFIQSEVSENQGNSIEKYSEYANRAQRRAAQRGK